MQQWCLSLCCRVLSTELGEIDDFAHTYYGLVCFEFIYELFISISIFGWCVLQKYTCMPWLLYSPGLCAKFSKSDSVRCYISISLVGVGVGLDCKDGLWDWIYRKTSNIRDILYEIGLNGVCFIDNWKIGIVKHRLDNSDSHDGLLKHALSSLNIWGRDE